MKTQEGTRDFLITFINVNIKIPNNPIERCSTSFITIEIQIKSMMWVFPRMNTTEKTENVQYYWQEYREMDLSYAPY